MIDEKTDEKGEERIEKASFVLSERRRGPQAHSSSSTSSPSPLKVCSRCTSLLALVPTTTLLPVPAAPAAEAEAAVLISTVLATAEMTEPREGMLGCTVCGA